MMTPINPFRRLAQLNSLLDIAKAMTVEHDLDGLLQLILLAAARMVEAERCSLFLVDRDSGQLWTKIAHGFDLGSEIRVPLGVGIAGHVAQSGQVVRLEDAYDDPHFSSEVDRRTGYRTRTLLCVPMKNMHGVIGVIQALNKEHGTFTADDEELLLALGGQAASALENALLYEEIQRLFDGFVKAAVVAIESRDPTTGGHSERVARLTLSLLDAVEQHGRGPWQGLQFTAQQRQELRYAALLHDFGKVGVREDVLRKANKLYPWEQQLLEQRFAYAKKSLEVESLRRQVELMRAGADERELLEEEGRLRERHKELEQILSFLLSCNRPTVLPRGGFERLAEYQHLTFPGADGQQQPLLTADEVVRLSIPKGSLSFEERLEIESHVTHTYRFLSQIPWTRGLRRVPEIACGHHERLDGQGYPMGLIGGEICVETRMMAIADVYDALTASDRPYKKAMPHAFALQVLQHEVERGKMDAELFRLFVEAEIPRQVLGSEFLVRVSRPLAVSLGAELG